VLHVLLRFNVALREINVRPLRQIGVVLCHIDVRVLRQINVRFFVTSNRRKVLHESMYRSYVKLM
jgi:hypothetical protein